MSRFAAGISASCGPAVVGGKYAAIYLATSRIAAYGGAGLSELSFSGQISKDAAWQGSTTQPSSFLKESLVKIKNIGRCEFDQLLPHHRVLESLMGEQVTWFANKPKNLIGTIALAKVGRSWNYAVLRRNDLGHFQVCDVGQNFFNLNQAIVQFTYAMGTATLKSQEACPNLE